MQEAHDVELIQEARNLIFLARQPIFDRDLNVHAYELLFRSEDSAAADIVDGNTASSQVMINAFLEMGIENIADDHVCFVNLTRDFIVGQLPLPLPLPANAVVIEVLEDIPVDDELLSSLRLFAAQGFTLALDDYVFSDDKEALINIVDIVKVDLMGCDMSQLQTNVNKLRRHNIKLLAEKVETQEDYELCKALGFDYFQGYFFSKPVVMKGQGLKPSRLALLNILIMLEDPDCDVSVLEDLISQDVTISYKILRIINSAFYGFRHNIDSVKQAVVSLGLKTIREWFILIALTSIEDKPRELIFVTLQRARMMQLLAEDMGLFKDSAFTTGLFSSIDAIMDQPMESILAVLPLSDDIGQALLLRKGRLGELLNIVIHYGQGDWHYLKDLRLDKETLSSSYFESMVWARGLLRASQTG